MSGRDETPSPVGEAKEATVRGLFDRGEFDRWMDGVEWVNQAFREFLDNASERGHAWFHGVLRTLAVLHTLPENDIELWERRAKDVSDGRCPLEVLGETHDDGRAWCAVCGNLPQEVDAV